jgi:CheY-like chemotaxis protein
MEQLDCLREEIEECVSTLKRCPRPDTFIGRKTQEPFPKETVPLRETKNVPHWRDKRERPLSSRVKQTGEIAGMVPLPEADGAPVRILLVEDEFYIRMDIADALRKVGFVVVEAGSADEAATFLQSGESVDLVFTDINLPGVLNGLSLAAQIRSTFPMMPVLIGSGGIERESEASRLGKFVAKPYDMRRLVRLVTDILGSSPE